MALGEAYNAWSRGEGVSQAFGYLWLSQEDVDNNRQVTNRLDALNRQAFDTGRISELDYAERTSRNHTSAIADLLRNPDSSPAEGFVEGFKEGAANVQGSIKGAIMAPINFTLGSIPWPVWLGIGVWGAWKLGLLGKLLKK